MLPLLKHSGVTLLHQNESSSWGWNSNHSSRVKVAVTSQSCWSTGMGSSCVMAKGRKSVIAVNLLLCSWWSWRKMDLVIVKLGAEQEDNSFFDVQKFFFSSCAQWKLWPHSKLILQPNIKYSTLCWSKKWARSFIIERGVGQISRSDVIESISEKEDVHLFILLTIRHNHSSSWP